MSRTRIALLLVLAVVAVPLASGTGVYPVDRSHPLADQQSVDQFNQTGHVQANLTVLNMGVTIADDHEAANMSGFYSDAGKVWLCLDYRESIKRTVRISFPAGYFEPRPAQVQSATSDHTATLAVRGNWTTVTVTFDGPGRACFPISTASGTYWGIKGGVNEWLNNTTGWSMPTFRDEANQWRRLPTTAWNDSTMVRLSTKGKPLTIQYDAAAGPETSWLRVPECSNIAEQRICRYTEAPRMTNSTNATVVLMSTQDNPPPVRYKYGEDTSAGLLAGLRDIQQGIDNFVEDLTGWFGGGSASDGGES